MNSNAFRAGCPLVAAGRIIVSDGDSTWIEPFFGRVEFRESHILWTCTGLTVAADPDAEVRIDQAVRPGWIQGRAPGPGGIAGT
jgi:hypothetical protein